MAVKYICDRCGKETKDIYFSTTSRGALMSFNSNWTRSYHLCPECAVELEQWIIGKPTLDILNVIDFDRLWERLLADQQECYLKVRELGFDIDIPTELDEEFKQEIIRKIIEVLNEPKTENEENETEAGVV